MRARDSATSQLTFSIKFEVVVEMTMRLVRINADCDVKFVLNLEFRSFLHRCKFQICFYLERPISAHPFELRMFAILQVQT